MKVILAAALVGFVCVTNAQQTSAPYTRQEIVHDLFLAQRTSSQHLSSNDLSDDEQEAVGVREHKSVATAAIYSLLLPGMGELYTGNYNMGKYFTIVEGALWITYFGTDQYANWLQNDSYQFAAQHSGAKISGKDDQFFINIGNDSDVYSYDQRMLVNRQQYNVYSTALNSPYYWKWDTDGNRTIYRDMRVSSNQMFDNTHFVIGVIVLNHLISAVNAARLAMSYNKNIDHSELLDIHANLIGSIYHPDGMKITVSKSF